ncbi:MAG: hypothetical protein AB7Q97_24750 [Gammaproteobacteria bacterium]
MKASRSIFKVACAATALTVAAGAAAADSTAAALEKRLQQMEQDMAALRAEIATLKAGEPAQVQSQQRLEQRVASVEASAMKQVDERLAKVEAARPPAVPGNMIFFRGGHTGLSEGREFGAFTDIYGLGTDNDNDSGWYVGAGFDFLLTRDVWGMLPGTWALAELAVEFSSVDSEETPLVVPTAECALATGNVGAALPNCLITGTNNVTQLTVSASPKIKFMEGSALRPWIIPVGLDFRVISPPSDSSAYLDVGAQFAVGADYELIPGIKLGADFRYHIGAGLTNPDYSAATMAAIRGLGLQVNEPDNDYWTVGAYLGIGF